MTRVCFREYYDNLLIMIEGHSGFSVAGTDVVCAGISTLCYTLLNAVKDEEASGNLKLIRSFVCDGAMCLEIERFSFSKERVDSIVSTIMTGFYMLEETYPQYVRVE